MIKAMIFDLDGTLMDTEKLKEYLFDFLVVCGFEGEKVRDIYKSARDGQGKNKFTLDNFKDNIKTACAKEKKDFAESKWQETLKKIYDKKNWLIAGANEVLRMARDKKIPVYILTLGVPQWQNEKIRLAGLDKILPEAQIKYTVDENVQKGKIKEIKEILAAVGSKNGENVLFFNDKPDETKEIIKASPKLKVFVRREKRDKRFTNKDYEELEKMPQVMQISEKFDFLNKIKEIV